MKKFCADCCQEINVNSFRLKGLKKDGSPRYEKYCKTHSRIRDRLRKKKKNTKGESIEPHIERTVDEDFSMKKDEIKIPIMNECEQNAFNEFIGILKEEYEDLKGQKIYVKV